MANIKIRKQLRLGDIYRYIVTGDMPAISRVEYVHFTAGKIVIKMDNYSVHEFNCVSENGLHNEKALREAIKKVNKIISEV